jgi:hypothetical protein
VSDARNSRRTTMKLLQQNQRKFVATPYGQLAVLRDENKQIPSGQPEKVSASRHCASKSVDGLISKAARTDSFNAELLLLDPASVLIPLLTRYAAARGGWGDTPRGV